MRLQPLTAAPSAVLLKPESRLRTPRQSESRRGRDVPRILVGVLTGICPCATSLQHLLCRGRRGRVHNCIPHPQSPRGTESMSRYGRVPRFHGSEHVPLLHTRPSSPSVVNGS
nr:uncharacterized protein LOC127330162 [Lolium perenne]